jgi:hypothetical protein
MSEDALNAEFLVQTLVELLDLDLQCLVLERPLHEDLEPLDVHGLGQKIDRAPLHRLDRRINISIRRHHDDGRPVGHRERLVDHLQSTLATGHAQVGQDDVEFLRLHQVERLIRIAGHRHVVALLQGLLQAFAGVLLVVYDQYARDHGLIHTRPMTDGQARRRRSRITHRRRQSLNINS